MPYKLVPIYDGMCAVVGSFAATSMTYVAQIDPSTLDAWGKLPATAILGAVCVTCVYLLYRSNGAAYQRAREHEESILSVVKVVSDNSEAVAKSSQAVVSVTEELRRISSQYRQLPCMKAKGEINDD